MNASPEITISEEQLATAARALQAGQLVAFPTETVYGLGADSTNPRAVAAVFELKQRPDFDPLIVHVASFEMLDRLVEDVPPVARTLMEHFWPGPLTVVLPKREHVLDLVTSGLPRVAVRWPAHPIAQRLIHAASVPIAAPSANRFGEVSPTTAAHVRASLGTGLDDVRLTILDGGPCQVGVESTVVAFAENRVQILRPGGIPQEAIEALIGRVDAVSGLTALRPTAPGMLARHYAPHTSLHLVHSWEEAQQQASSSHWKRWGLLCLQPPTTTFADRDAAACEIRALSDRGDLREAAMRLFAELRALDERQLDGLCAIPVPEVGLGRAINDRLRRAAARAT